MRKIVCTLVLVCFSVIGFAQIGIPTKKGMVTASTPKLDKKKPTTKAEMDLVNAWFLAGKPASYQGYAFVNNYSYENVSLIGNTLRKVDFILMVGVDARLTIVIFFNENKKFYNVDVIPNSYSQDVFNSGEWDFIVGNDSMGMTDDEVLESAMKKYISVLSDSK